MFKSRRRRRLNIPLFLFLCVLIAIAVGALILLAVSYIMTKLDISSAIAKIISLSALAVGSYFGGYICAKKYRKNGLIRGAVCGLIIFAVVFTTGSVFLGGLMKFSSIARLLIVIAAGAVGGAFGVNSKRKRY